MIPRWRVLAAAALVGTIVSTSAVADPLSVEAFDNATVQPAGPRSGSNGKNFFNVEGSANGSFASYGVADFSFGALPLPVIAINTMQLQLVQSNAAFSAAGPVLISVDQNAPLADIQPGGTSPLAFDGADPGTATDEGQGDISLIALGGGPFNYAVGTSGDVDSYNFTLSPAAEAELISRVNNGETIRLVIGTGSSGLAATWAGFSNSTFMGPTLNLDVIYDTGVPAATSTWGRIKAAYR